MPPRLEGHPELLDDPHADPAAFARSLTDLRRINRLLGFTGDVVRDTWPLVEASAGPGRPVVVLDAGTGSGDIALALARRAARRGVALLVLGLDSHPTVLRVAARHVAGAPLRSRRAVRLVRGDALRLPLPDRSVDVAVASLLVHHLEGADATALLAELRRVSRVGAVVSDLVRHPLALLGFRALTRLVPVHPMTRHDGALSVRRAFTPEELARLAAAAGLGRGGRLVRHLFWRMAWIWTRPGDEARHRDVPNFGPSPGRRVDARAPSRG